MSDDDDEPTLFDIAHARRDDPITSHEAAASIEPDKIRASQQAVLLVLRRLGPMTDTALLERYFTLETVWALPHQSPSGIRTRRSELVDKGKVVDSGQKALLETGRRAIIWATGQ